ncbi:MAG: 30S ribosomal protein S20 [Acidobacteriota bacterium]
MAQHQSAIRQWRRNLRRREVNRRNKSAVRSEVKRIRQALEEKKAEEAARLLPKAFSQIDRCVKKGAIHRSKGNRLKSRLSRQVAMLNPSSSK